MRKLMTAVALVALVGAGGCGESVDAPGTSGGAIPTDPSTSAPSTTASAGIVLLVWPPLPDPPPGVTPTVAGMAAIVRGRIHIDVTGGCVLLDGDAGEPVAVVWPPGTSMVPGDEAVVLSDGTAIRDGDAVEGGGGYLSLDAVRAVVGPVDLPAECPYRTDEIAVFNQTRDDPGIRVTASSTDPAPVTSSAAVAPSEPSSAPSTVSGPDAASAMCFQTLAPAASSGAIRVEAWPDALPALLVLLDDGSIVVVEDGTATPWTQTGRPGYLWARWAADGSIIASRLDGHDVVWDRLNSPGHAEELLRLGFTVKADAPAGFCPIDGYLAPFAVTGSQLVLEHHMAGPVAHSCPAPTSESVDTDPWRCQSQEGIAFQARSLDPAVAAEPLGLQIGGDLAQSGIVSDSAASSAFVIDEHGRAMVLRPDGQPPCCFGGTDVATAFAISPDGQLLAEALDGTHVAIANLDRVDGSHRDVWDAPEPVEEASWTGDWLAVVHGTSITLVTTAGATPTTPIEDLPTHVVTLDWAA